MSSVPHPRPADDDTGSSRKTREVARLIAERHGRPIRKLLVVGCGHGEEARVLSRELDCDVVGIDVADGFEPSANARVALEFGDATALQYASGSFDYVYSYHVLEHIPHYRKALREMHRVLGAQGGFCIGVPNRLRLVGYLGSKTREATPLNKLRWNLADWNARLHGRFRNEFGAHAGFAPDELRGELAAVFSSVHSMTLAYYRAIYPRHDRKVAVLDRSGLGRFAFPAVYYTGLK